MCTGWMCEGRCRAEEELDRDVVGERDMGADELDKVFAG